MSKELELKSEAEQALVAFWDELNKKSFVSIDDLYQFQKKLYGVMRMCEDLRKSRDSWRAKYDKLKQSSSG